MLRSSIGFHTITLTSSLFNTREELMEEVKEYSRKVGGIEIYTDNYGNTIIKFRRQDKRDMGIEWMIRPNIWQDDIRMFVSYIYATINPKVLGGVTDYITAATLADMNTATANFNSISASLSELMPTFQQYHITRVDYCVNFSLNELAPGWGPEEAINLIKRSDIPFELKNTFNFHFRKRKTHKCFSKRFRTLFVQK